MQRPFSRSDAERFVYEAEECFRCARVPNLKAEIAEGLEVAGRELMAMAVDIETRDFSASKEERDSSAHLRCLSHVQS